GAAVGELPPSVVRGRVRQVPAQHRGADGGERGHHRDPYRDDRVRVGTVPVLRAQGDPRSAGRHAVRPGRLHHHPGGRPGGTAAPAELPVGHDHRDDRRCPRRVDPAVHRILLQAPQGTGGGGDRRRCQLPADIPAGDVPARDAGHRDRDADDVPEQLERVLPAAGVHLLPARPAHRERRHDGVRRREHHRLVRDGRRRDHIVAPGGAVVHPVAALLRRRDRRSREVMTTDRPNILLLCTDQQRYNTLGAYGNTEIETPNLDRLADQGVLFENCYVQCTVCAPSRASLMTGQYVHSHGLWANGVTLPGHQRVFSEELAERGYDCGLVGKYHLTACHAGRTESAPPGMRTFRWAHDPYPGSSENAYHRWLAAAHPDVHEQAMRS